MTDPAPLRLWPAWLALILQWFLRFVLPEIVPDDLAPDAKAFGLLGALVCGLAIFAWWTFFSRASRAERWGGMALMLLVLALMPFVVHESVATGMMGLMPFLYAIPVLSLALVVQTTLLRNASVRTRRWTLVPTVIVACAGWAFVRTGGITGGGESEFAWRWSPTHEEQLLALGGDELGEVVVIEAGNTGASWPGFRGAERNSAVAGVQLATDWGANPPTELWRRAVGPAWSSFAVRGRRSYTQEQRGEEELVSCYDVETGEPIWRHADPVRFWESNAGAGPRATPTLAGERLLTFGATGVVNALDANTGALLWSRDAAADTGVEIPEWGFSSSPWVHDELVVVAPSGTLIAYDVETGEPRWRGPFASEPRGSYSSPQGFELDGVEQILLLCDAGVTSVAPADGALLWEYPWSGDPIVQPAQTPDGDVLLSISSRRGLLRLNAAREGAGWMLRELWSSIRLKPYFSDFVVHGEHAYGFDGSLLACIDLDEGARQWKGGRYGHGQLLLLRDQGLLLVITEEGELALVGATPEGFEELGRFPAIAGKTWNHPVLVGDVLLVRNGEEMAAFRLAVVGSAL